jgi:tetratricopeptide (TPR) repeat protein
MNHFLNRKENDRSMRYVPNLIPESSKVLPDYFKGSLYEATKKNPWRDVLLWILGISFFLAALVSIMHLWLLFLYGITGFILIPPGHKFIERRLHFRLTSKIKTAACAVLFIPSLPLTNHYSHINKQLAHQQKLLDEQTAKEKEIAEHNELQRKDSLAYYLQQGHQLSNQHKIDEAREKLQHALMFARTPSDKDLVEKEEVSIASVKVMEWVKSGKYKAALPEISALLDADPSNTELQYSRALCYSKTGKIQEAVNDLKPLIQAGNADAEKLHDKINPIRKKIVGTETLCCDGTTSNATGRGACSHHGGVCDWNHPIYEEYRKYE